MDGAAVFGTLTWTVTPRPIAWVTSRSPLAGNNLAPFSFFTVVSTDPAILMIAVEPNPDGSAKDTLVNIRATGEFVVHIAPARLAGAVAVTAEPYACDVDEITEAGLNAIPGRRVAVPVLPGTIAAFECVLDRMLRPGRETLVFGRVVGVHIDDEVIDERGRFVPERLSPLARIGTTFAEIALLTHEPG
ncbi:flavin reductase family protein [Mycolicibacterium sp.]|uniref:flavin reductase family protein n=1 Tax=Mycolicibacterium sp. TaxID=2320850 RepID=UPI003D0C76D9